MDDAHDLQLGVEALTVMLRELTDDLYEMRQCLEASLNISVNRVRELFDIPRLVITVGLNSAYYIPMPPGCYYGPPRQVTGINVLRACEIGDYLIRVHVQDSRLQIFRNIEPVLVFDAGTHEKAVQIFESIVDVLDSLDDE